jgi:myo-inositol-1(or 4)-monophosphatase
MDIDFFRQIGRKLFKEISERKLHLSIKSLGKGASGDETFLVDKLAEDIIIQSIEKAGLNLNVITEEAGSKIVEGQNQSIIIDPIDGSKNAVSGIPFFSTSIAIADGNTLRSLKIGYIINLINADEFWAMKGKGAFMNGIKIETKKKYIPFIVAFESSSPYSDLQRLLPLLKRAYRVRCFGSTALDLAYLSAGMLTIFISLSPSRIFDFSAGILIAKEAEATVTDVEGREIDELPVRFTTRTSLLVSASEEIHKKALKLIRA